MTLIMIVIGIVPKLSLAASITDMTPDEIASDLEDRYHIDPSAVRDTAHTTNVGNKKGNYPQVTLGFSPSSPKVGVVETAKATPMFFVNNTKKLYFTWYLKHKGCDAKEEDGYKTPVTKSTPSYCDVDKDGYITPNDWKITAMKLIVLNGYNRNDPNLGVNSAPPVADDKDGYQAVIGGDDAVETQKWCYVADPNSGLAYELNSVTGQTNETLAAAGSRCGPNLAATYFPNHLFARQPSFTTGDGSFKTDEEDAWETDPNNPSTAHNGQKDEANVVGLGIDSFSWVYTTGDKVGVAIEGTSMVGTKHNETSSMIMWAFPLDVCHPQNTSSYVSMIGGNNDPGAKQFPVIIHTAAMDHTDFDRCFADNLIDPSKGGQPTNMKINVSSSPSNPVAQVFGPNDVNPQGDTVTVQAQTEDSTEDPASIWYGWNIYLSTDGSMNTDFNNPAAWALLNTNKNFIDNKQAGILEGNGRNEISINLNFSEALAKDFPRAFSPQNNVGYLYIKVGTRENFSQDQGRAGTSFLVVEFNLLGGDHIIVSTVKPVDDKSGMTLVSRDQEICLNAKALAQCKLMQYQIVGVSVSTANKAKYDTFIWKINDKPLECNTRISPECFDDMQAGEAFFPVLGNPGEQYVVTVVETDSKTGETLTLTRRFPIVNPALEIVPAKEDGSSNVLPKLLGFYKNLDGTSFPDYSPDTFETTEGKIITLKSLFNADNLQGNTKLLWLVDDVTALHVDPATGILTIPVEKQNGSTIKVSIKGIYYQPQVIRKALRDIWNVSPDVSIETNFEDSIAVNVVPFGVGDGEDGNSLGILSVPNRYLGALLSYVPESVLFGLRLALTLAFVLFLAGFIQSFLPGTVVSKE